MAAQLTTRLAAGGEQEAPPLTDLACVPVRWLSLCSGRAPEGGALLQQSGGGQPLPAGSGFRRAGPLTTWSTAGGTVALHTGLRTLTCHSCHSLSQLPRGLSSSQEAWATLAAGVPKPGALTLPGALRTGTDTVGSH